MNRIDVLWQSSVIHVAKIIVNQPYRYAVVIEWAAIYHDRIVLN